MKKLSIEQKAKRYDELKVTAQELEKDGCFDKITLFDLFPELKESEDERVRKVLVGFFKNYKEQGTIGAETFNGIPTDKILAWLEKHNLIMAKSPQLDEQKPTDKTEPKFKNGQWIVWQDKCYKVNYNGCGYELVYQNGFSTSLEYGTIDENAHLWDITKDAKDGDVLHSTGWHNDCIFIFNSLDNWKFDEPNGDTAVATGYCCLSVSADKMEFGIQGPDCVEVNTVKPATKIQRDLLFQKMKEAGYEWDVEKKELKKIKQKFAEWSENGSKELSLSLQIQTYLNIVNDALYAKGKPLYSEERIKDIHKCMLMWQKIHNTYFYQKPAWSEEDEKVIHCLEYTVKHFYEDEDTIKWCCEWLKSLKDRVPPQPKQEWSVDDERTYRSVLYAFEHHFPLNCVQQEFVKSHIQSQNRWKPSDTEINILQGVIDDSFKPENVKVTLTNILEQLKELRD